MSILEKIIAHKKIELENLPKFTNLAHSERDFGASLARSINPTRTPRIIAEIKKISPSRGDIFPDLVVKNIANIYQQNGARAISVLTDRRFFGGDLTDLQTASAVTTAPILRKDFIFEEQQIWESRHFGADAFLLMVAVIKNTDKLRDLREAGESVGMQALVEVHDLTELSIAVTSGAKIIGVNARNFENLEVSMDNFAKLLPQIPTGIIRVAESGFDQKEQVWSLANKCEGVLVGTAFMRVHDDHDLGIMVKSFANI